MQIVVAHILPQRVSAIADIQDQYIQAEGMQSALVAALRLDMGVVVGDNSKFINNKWL